LTDATPPAPTWPATPDWPRVRAYHRDGSRAGRLRLAVDGDAPWLAGHFPDRPVLPGVVLLRWAIEVTARLWPDLGDVTAVSQLKFRKPVLPPADLDLTLELQSDKQGRRLVFRFERDGAPCAQGRVHYP